MAYGFALSDKTLIDKLQLTFDTPGPIFTTFGDNKEYNQTNRSAIFEQGCVGMTLDDFIFKHRFPTPQYLKIDVDRIEAKTI